MPIHFHLSSTGKNANQYSKTYKELQVFYILLSTFCKIAKPAKMVRNHLIDWSIIAGNFFFFFVISLISAEFTIHMCHRLGYTVHVFSVNVQLVEVRK